MGPERHPGLLFLSRPSSSSPNEAVGHRDVIQPRVLLISKPDAPESTTSTRRASSPPAKLFVSQARVFTDGVAYALYAALVNPRGACEAAPAGGGSSKRWGRWRRGGWLAGVRAGARACWPVRAVVGNDSTGRSVVY